jgi:hypothetical protein
MRWAGYVAGMVVRRVACRVMVGKPQEKIHLKDPGVDGKKY